MSNAAVHREPPAEFRDPAIPEIATAVVSACIVCGGTNTVPHARGYDYELRTCRNEWTFVRCTSCNHVWLNPRPAVETLGVIYPPHYYAYDYETRVNAVARWAKAALDKRKLAGVLAHAPRAPRSYLDIGCGSGRYLRAMAERGLDQTNIHGLELDQHAVDALARDGYRVARARVEEADISAASIDLATMFHVIEHVASPDHVVRRIAGWLAPGGLLAIETPNLDALDRRIFSRTYWGGYHIPRHWHLFDERTLTRLFENAGLSPIATIYQTGHSFWMYSMHHWLRYEGTPHRRLAAMFDPFTNVIPLAAFTAFDKTRAILGARTSAVLMIAQKRA